MEWALMIIGAIVLYGIIQASTPAPGRSLQKKFVELGTLAGKTKQEVIAAAGQPNSISAAGDGKDVLQWMATGYHIALIFDGEVCEGVTHEFSAPASP